MQNTTAAPAPGARAREWLCSMGRAASLFSSVFECILCLRLVRFNVLHIDLPCGSGICSKLELDALSHPAGIYIGWYGLVGAALMVGFHAWLAINDSRVVRVSTSATAWAGAIVSLALTGHVYLAYHGVCPWCMASAAAWYLCLGGWLIGDVTPARRLARFWLCAGALTLLAAALETGVESHLRATGADLTGVTLSDVVVAGRAVSVGAGREFIVMFVDLDCPACRKTIERALSSRGSADILLRIGRANSEYAYNAALLVLGCPTVELRRTVLRELLKDATDSGPTVARLGKLLPQDYALRAYDALDADLRMAQRIRLHNLPLLIRVNPGGMAVMDRSELK